LKIVRLLLLGCFVCLLGSFAGAQSIDAFFGMNTLITRPTQSNYPNLGGGLYPTIGADLMLWHTLGFGGEVAWRGSTGSYFNPSVFVGPVRPIFYDFNLVFTPPIPRITPELQAGFGAESLRYYQPYYNCSSFSGCTNYLSSNHILGHLGAGLRFYVRGHIFLRPEAHFYFVRHNTADFYPNSAVRVGMSIGYTLGPS
jgi:hypothetical protein